MLARQVTHSKIFSGQLYSRSKPDAFQRMLARNPNLFFPKVAHLDISFRLASQETEACNPESSFISAKYKELIRRSLISLCTACLACTNARSDALQELPDPGADKSYLVGCLHYSTMA